MLKAVYDDGLSVLLLSFLCGSFRLARFTDDTFVTHARILRNDTRVRISVLRHTLCSHCDILCRRQAYAS